jgi:RNA polymerase sigma-70 factor (ECF subfamily)
MKDVRVTDATSGPIERVYREEGERLWRAVFAYVGDRAIADDAVAEAFAQALRRGDGIRDPGRWVWTAAFRIARGELARRGRSDGAIPESSYELPDRSDEVVRALLRLSPKQRAAVVLHHYAGYPVKDIAKMLDSTTAAVKVHLSQGRKRLRSLLDEEVPGGA